MTELEKKSARTGLIFSIIFAIAFIFCCIFIRQPQKVVYKTIQIQLASTPVKKAEQPKAQTKAPAKKAEPKPKTKTASASSETANVSSGPKIKKSVEELMAEQNAPKAKKAEWDDSLFDDAPVVENKASAPKKATSSSSISGTAATVSKSSSSASASSSSSSNASSASTAASSTAQALQNMSESVYSMTVADGIKSRTDIVSDSTSGKVSIKMSDGRSRQLIKPSKPTLYIDEDNARLLDTSRTVTISFTVLADGTVPLGDISISPASILPLEIQREIKEQIAMWLFTSEPSGAKGTASFKYTLEIK